MGNYHFIWQSVDGNGNIESICEQTIYGESLASACEYFEGFHGQIGPDDNGSSINIVSVTLDKAENK